ncbi:unnamed protein product [Laminaria digitata]
MSTSNPLDSQEDIVSHVLSFCPPDEFLYLAGASEVWKSAWTRSGRPKRTSVRSAAAYQTSRTEWALGDPKLWETTLNLSELLSSAATSGNLAGLKATAAKIGPGWVSPKFSRNVAGLAAAGGHVETLEWALEQGCPCGLYTCAFAAAERGDLGLLRWARRNGHAWDRFVCYYAARGGHFEMLRWATEQGCPLDKLSCGDAAAERGHREIEEWVKRQG